MDDSIEFVVNHAWSMILSVDGPSYVGGDVVEVEMMKLALTFAMMKKICIRELNYKSVERMFFLTPGSIMTDAVKLITTDGYVEKVKHASNLGVVTLFVETTRDGSYMGDNEEEVSGWEHGHGDSDTDAEQYVVRANVGVIHLISDSDRTTDPEFLEAMENLGVASRRRRIRTNLYPNGMEVDQLNKFDTIPE